MAAREVRDSGQEARPGDQIDLVESHEDRALRLAKQIEQARLARPATGGGIHDPDDEVAGRQSVRGVANHRCIHSVLGSVDTGRVEERDLRIGQSGHAQNALACRLRFVRHDRDLLAHETVHEGGLARIGKPDDGNGAGSHRAFRFQLSAFSGELSGEPG